MQDNIILQRLQSEKLIIIGHRGAAGLERENTLKSIKRAMELGVDVVEVDVRATKDGKIIVLHDDNLERVFGINIKAKDLSYNELIKRIDLSEDERVPLLDEVIDLIDGRIGLFIEIKEPDITKEVIQIIEGNKASDWVGIVSFFDESLILSKKMAPEIPTGLIYFKPPGRIFDAKKIGASIVLPRYNLATEKANKVAHKLRLYVVTWTVNSLELARRVVRNGVDGIATDFPDKIMLIKNELD